jgi:hypothetical protein
MTYAGEQLLPLLFFLGSHLLKPFCCQGVITLHKVKGDIACNSNCSRIAIRPTTLCSS